MYIPLLFLTLASVPCFAQVGGMYPFEFVNVPGNSRLAALGGVNVSLADRDVNFFSSNPALVSDSLQGSASVNYQFYVADIGHGFVSYSHRFPRWGAFAFGIQNINYKTIQGYDVDGSETGEFQSGETALLISKTHQVGNFRLGATVKAVFSNIAGYTASGAMADFGGLFMHPDRQLTVALVIKNIGVRLSEYSVTSHTRLPIDVQVGATLKPEHMPLRFSLAAFNLTQPDVTYYDPAQEDKPGILTKVLSHFALGTEILIHKNVNVMAGYNYFVHQALKLSGGGGGAGVSFGFSAAIKTIEFVFSRNTFVAGNAGYSFTLSTDLNTILKRK